MRNMALQPLYAYRDLLVSWTYRTVRSRYQQSILGGLWAVLQPVSTVAIFTVIFTLFIPVNTGDVPYLIFSYTAMVPWTLFSGATLDMAESLVSNFSLITKIYFPREILPVAALLARLVDFAIAFGILFIMMIFYKMPMVAISWVYLPVILATQLALAAGIGLAGAALNVFYRDIRHLFALGLQLWFYATPIVYPVSVVPEKVRPFYFLNPMVGVTESYRAVLLRGELPGSYLLISAVVATTVLFIGYWFFKRVEIQFADVV